MRVGILGTGFGAYHASLYKRIKGVESIKIFGRNEEKLRSIGENLQIEVTNNINDIIYDPKIDLVDICLPTKEHSKYIIDSLKSGKNVFCETPLCYSREEIFSIMESERKFHKKVFVDLFIKFSPEYRYIYESIKNNTYGSLKSLYITRKTPPLWGDLGLSSITTNLMIHDLDFAVWLLGSPIDLSASGISAGPEESYVNASLKYRDVLVKVEASSMMPKCYPFTVGYEAIFENGMVEYKEQFTSNGNIKSIIEYTAERKNELNLGNIEPYELSIAHVIECCKENRETLLSVQYAAKSLEIAYRLKDLIVKQTT